MRKLSQLEGDEFMDVFNALCPLLPVLESIDLGSFKEDKKSTKDKKSAEERGISMFVGIIVKLIPIITSKENRHCIWELISILDETPVDKVKKYPAPKLMFKIRKVFSDGDLMDFLSYAEESATAE